MTGAKKWNAVHGVPTWRWLPLLAAFAASAWIGCSETGGTAGGNGDGVMLPDGGKAGTGTDSGTGTIPEGTGEMNKFPAGCAANSYHPAAGEGCTAECSDCDCTGIKYTCSKDCFNPAKMCGISVDPTTGAATPTTGVGSGCKSLSCTPENDLSNELACTASECQPPLKSVQLAPSPSIDVNRAPRNAGLIFTVDTSGSMTSRQMASACAAQSFVTAANNGQWSAGVMTQDVTRWLDPNTQAPLMSSPTLLKTNTCGAPLTCSCPLVSTSNAPCTFSPGGTMLQSSDPNAVTKLKELLVQGDNESGDGDEAGLEKAFLYVLGEWKAGRKDTVGQVVAISDEEANDDNRICGLQADRQKFVPYYQSILGAGFNPPANKGNCNADLTAFYIYAFKYMNVQVNALCDPDGSVSEKSVIYPAVAAATGGFVTSIGKCETFTDFFTKIGTSTATLSTNICLPQVLDPSTLKVTHTPVGGAPQNVPQSATDGWTYDASLKCIVFHGTWEKAYGSYQLNQGAGSSRVCFAAGVRPNEASIKVSVKGTPVPKSAADGWTYDAPAGCIDLHGSYSNNPGPYDVQYL